VGLVLEVARDLGPTTSVSVQRNLTDPLQPTRYSARYRLSDKPSPAPAPTSQGNNTLSIEF
jgi:translocation and assembly module TamB